MAAGAGRRTDAAVRLGNGHQLGFAEWGDPRGTPVLFFHPTPGSRRLAISSDAAAYELGVRLIALERPGFGLSHYQRGRSIRDWPADVAEFTDLLGLGTFAVAAVSGGAPYALACGAHISERLTGIGIVAGLTPPEICADDPIISLVRRDPDQARRILHDQITSLAGDVNLAVAALADRDGPDHHVYQDPDVQTALRATCREALRSGSDGIATDTWLLHSPWHLSLEDVTPRVHWWHGDTDPLTPLAYVERTVRRLPRATLTVLAGEGHTIDLSHGDEILATVATWG